jgi:hypothetical protein
MDFPEHIRKRMNGPDDYFPVEPMSKEKLEDEVKRLRQNRDWWHGACLQAWEHRDGANLQVTLLEAEVERLTAERDEALRQLGLAMRYQAAVDAERAAPPTEGGERGE